MWFDEDSEAEGNQDGSIILFPNQSFWAPLNDLGSGLVNTSLVAGVGSATFTRATTATTIGSTGLVIKGIASGAARSRYDPTTLEYQGYFAEAARTNFSLQSEDLDTTWVTNGTTPSVNAATSPDGTANADDLVEDAVNAAHSMGQTVTVSAGVAITLSAFVKPSSGGRYFRLQASSDAGANGFRWLFNPDTGAQALAGAAFGTGTFVGATIKQYPNGWFRISATGTCPAATVSINGFLQDQTSSYTATYNGNGTSGLYVWGCQCEEGSFASSYIPTTTATVTRNADVLTYIFTGNADAAQGWAYGEFALTHSTTVARMLLGIVASEQNAFLSVPTGQASTTIFVRDGTTAVSKTGLSDLSTGVRKRASAWGGSTMAVTGDGVAVGSGAFDGSLGSAGIGVLCHTGGTQQPFGTTKNIRIGKIKANNQRLQMMTR